MSSELREKPQRGDTIVETSFVYQEKPRRGDTIVETSIEKNLEEVTLL